MLLTFLFWLGDKVTQRISNSLSVTHCLSSISGGDPLDASDQGGAERPGNGGDGRQRGPAGGALLLEQPLLRPVRHQPAATAAWRHTHTHRARDLQVLLRRSLLQTGQTDTGTVKQG